MERRGRNNQIKDRRLEINRLELAQPHLERTALESFPEEHPEPFSDLDSDYLCARIEQWASGLPGPWANLQDLASGSQAARLLKMGKYLVRIARAAISVPRGVRAEQ